MTSPVMKTLLLNPPSFKNFDGGASSRWPATREIASYWYPVWLSYPAGMLPGSRLLDAPPHGVTPEQTIEIARDYDFVVLFTSTVGFANDVLLARAMKQARPGLKIAFVGPPVQIKPDCLVNNPEIDFIVTGEFDHSVVEFAEGKPLSQIAGDENRRSARAERHSAAGACRDGVVAGLTRSRLEVAKHQAERLAHRFALRPAGERFDDRLPGP